MWFTASKWNKSPTIRISYQNISMAPLITATNSYFWTCLNYLRHLERLQSGFKWRRKFFYTKASEKLVANSIGRRSFNRFNTITLLDYTEVIWDWFQPLFILFRLLFIFFKFEIERMENKIFKNRPTEKKVMDPGITATRTARNYGKTICQVTFTNDNLV